MRPATTESSLRRVISTCLVLMLLTNIGCSTVRTIPVSEVSYQVDDPQALTDINASAARKTPQVTLALSDLTPAEAALLEGKRVRLYTNEDVQSVRIDQLDFPYIDGTIKQRTRKYDASLRNDSAQIRINLGEVNRIEIDNAAVRLKVESDSLIWHSRAGELQQASWAQVESIRFVSRGRGALDGLKRGALVGLAVGLPFGLFGIGAVAWGAVLGSAIGFGVGHKDIYRFEQVDDKGQTSP